MSQTLDQVRALVARGDVRVSGHGYEELAADQIFVRDVIDGLAAAVVVEDILTTRKGPVFWSWNKIETANQFM